MSMLGIKLGGDPGSVRAVASWLRDSVAASADEVAELSRWARDRLGEDLWWDAAAILVYMHFDAGRRAAGEYADKVRDLARRFDDSADKLEYAMGLMADAKEQARLGGLEYTDEYIKPPPSLTPPYGTEWSSDERLQAAHRDEVRAYSERLRINREQWETYRRCEELVEAAAQTILDQMDALGRVTETDWTGLTFSAGAFVADETEALLA